MKLVILFSVLQSVHSELNSLTGFLKTYHYYYCYINRVLHQCCWSLLFLHTRMHRLWAPITPHVCAVRLCDPHRCYSRHVVLQHQYASTTSPITVSLFHYTVFLMFQRPPLQVNMTDSAQAEMRSCVCVHAAAAYFTHNVNVAVKWRRVYALNLYVFWLKFRKCANPQNLPNTNIPLMGPCWCFACQLICGVISG